VMFRCGTKADGGQSHWFPVLRLYYNVIRFGVGVNRLAALTSPAMIGGDSVLMP